MEVNIQTKEKINKLEKLFVGWEVLSVTQKPLEYKIIRNERSVLDVI
ncbi:hypothetical protein [Metabacillus halosaccharovorans]|uniref:Uncharacterized protein n=1 Tax=Metabacillus halosaccharovorans TaxID=930124 RepID=A0ABT3DDH0_9BACI|nr:hypothetical protein [Metabacillus halosaccharovorans]MCV9885105.1 hypothetical protein [Metabacillus halosaccharovorans]